MPQLTLQTQIALRNRVPTPLGQISSAATLVDAPGVPYSWLRQWGMYAVVLLLDGMGRYRDSNGITGPVNPGDMVLVFPDIGQAYGPVPGHKWTEIYVTFDGPVFHSARASGLLDPRDPVRHIGKAEDWLPRFAPFVREIPSTVSGKAQEVCRLLSLLTEILLPDTSTPLPSDWLINACHILEADLSKALSPASVAAQVAMPYESFRKRFRAQMGVSPARYHSLRRIDAAASLLDQGSLATAQIAEALGYADEFIFAKRFKLIKGMTPYQYRRRRVEEENSVTTQ